MYYFYFPTAYLYSESAKRIYSVWGIFEFLDQLSDVRVIEYNINYGTKGETGEGLSV